MIDRMKERILLCLAHMSGNEMKYIQEAFDTNWVVPLGPNVNAFEQELKNFVISRPDCSDGSDYKCSPQGTEPRTSDPDKLWPNGFERLKGKTVVALCSGTAAVHLALIELGVKAGDEVMCQSFTFCASSHPVTYQGATPVFVDSEPDTWNMDPELLDEAIRDRIAKTGRKPKAIIVVYLYGMPGKIAEILKVAEKYDIPLIEDAAEGLGSRYDDQVCGTFGKFGVLSFNGNKIITTSGGGALICPDQATKDHVMYFATQAREAYPYYQHVDIGYNYRLSNICAGIGRGQLTVLDEHIAHHRHVAKLYSEAFAKVDGITFHGGGDAVVDPAHAPQGHKITSNFWLNTITLDPSLKVRGEENAYKVAVKGAVGGAAGVVRATGELHTDLEPNNNVEALRVALDQANVESRPVWKPMHRQPVYHDAPAYVNGVSESIFKKGLCLPSGPLVTDEDVDYIVSTIKENLL